MNIFIIILLSAIIIVLLIQLRKILLFLRELHESVSKRKQNYSDINLSSYFLKYLLPLRGVLNETISERDKFEKELHFHNRQIQTTLNNIQSTVIILNEQNRVILCNNAAMKLLNRGESFVGKKIDALLHSSELAQMLIRAHKGEAVPMQQIDTMHFEKPIHLDVSAAPIHWIYDEFDHLVLLAIHDSTQLRQLERMRSEFVLNVSHELRTPITVIKGFSEILSEDASTLSKEQIKDYSDRIHKNSLRLYYLVEDLLTIARLENPSQHILNLEETDLAKLVHDFISNYHFPFRKSMLPFEFSNEAKNTAVLADPIRIEQVLENLANNANSYATDATKIAIHLFEDDDFVFCRFKDDGIGVGPKDLPNIFQRFYRVDKARSREDGGTGLGLSITKNIILQHKGNIKAESEPKHGLSITFSIPKLRKS